MKITDYSKDREKKLKRWKRNRDVTDGIDAVKDAGRVYLPRRRNDPANSHLIPPTVSAAGAPQQWAYHDHEYERLKADTEFYPASAKTLQSFVGLVFRKLPKLTGPDAITALKPVILRDGTSLEALARWAFREFCITNDGGLFVDHPDDTPAGAMMSDVVDVRPYVAPYCAESILSIDYGVVGGRRAIIRVHLKEEEDTVRVLELIGGIYTNSVIKVIDGKEMLISQVEPLIGGKKMNRIPFVHLGDSDSGAMFDDLCAANLVHYQHSANLASALKWISAPTIVMTGVAEDVELDLSEAAVWRFEDKDAKVGFNEYTGQGVPSIERKLDRIEMHMATLGSRMLANEKAAAEATETLARRQASENSILGAAARHVAERVEMALKILSPWIMVNPDDVSFTLSTDFIPSSVDPQLLAQVFALVTAGKLPLEAFFEFLQNGEILDEKWDYESYAASLDTGGTL